VPRVVVERIASDFSSSLQRNDPIDRVTPRAKSAYALLIEPIRDFIAHARTRRGGRTICGREFQFQVIPAHLGHTSLNCALHRFHWVQCRPTKLNTP
jgi:hypothetical protein